MAATVPSRGRFPHDALPILPYRRRGSIGAGGLLVFALGAENQRSNVPTLAQLLSARYDGRAAVLLEIRDDGGRQLAFVTARATRSLTVAEGASMAQREKVWFALTEDLVLDINRRLEVEARRHLRAYLFAR